MNEPATANSESLLGGYFGTPSDKTHPSMTKAEGAVQRLVLATRSGTCHSLPYALLGEIKHEPGEGLRLVFSSRLTVTLRGTHLEQLFAELNEQRVERIDECDPADAIPQRVCVAAMDFVE